MTQEIYDLIVIGAGPGGYVAALRAAQLGMKTVVVESRDKLGGVCLNEGCIPSKALLDSSEYFALARDKFASHGIDIEPPQLNLSRMMQRKGDIVNKLTNGIAFLFKKNNIALVAGTGRLSGSDGGLRQVAVDGTETVAPQILTGKRVLLATGSSALELPFAPFDGDVVVNARDALSFERVPEHLLVVGAGFIGLELGSVWRRLGSKVTVAELLPKPLPTVDGQVVDALIRSLKKQGISFRFETKVTGVEKQAGGALVRIEGIGGVEELICDKVLVAVGRKPSSVGLGLDKAGVEIDQHGRIVVDDNYMTKAQGIYAIGDLIAGPMLAHKAMEEGTVFAERLAGEASLVDYSTLPGICYTWPEAASVGKTEEQLKLEGMEYKVGRFNFAANGRACCLDETEGFVKMLANKNSGRILGVHIVGPRASEMIAEAVTIMTYGGTAQDVAMTFHAHPTLSEAMKEAALDVDKRAIHA